MSDNEAERMQMKVRVVLMKVRQTIQKHKQDQGTNTGQAISEQRDKENRGIRINRQKLQPGTCKQNQDLVQSEHSVTDRIPHNEFLISFKLWL